MKARHDAGHFQKELSEKSGVSQADISRLETEPEIQVCFTQKTSWSNGKNS